MISTAKGKKEQVKQEENVVQQEVKIKSKWFVVTPAGNEYLINKPEKKYDLIKYYRNVQSHDSHSGEVDIYLFV